MKIWYIPWDWVVISLVLSNLLSSRASCIKANLCLLTTAERGVLVDGRLLYLSVWQWNLGGRHPGFITILFTKRITWYSCALKEWPNFSLHKYKVQMWRLFWWDPRILPFDVMVTQTELVLRLARRGKAIYHHVDRKMCYPAALTALGYSRGCTTHSNNHTDQGTSMVRIN